MRTVSDLNMKGAKVAAEDVKWSASQLIQSDRKLAEDLLVGSCLSAVSGYTELNPKVYELTENGDTLTLAVK